MRFTCDSHGCLSLLPRRWPQALAFLRSKRMAGSVYAAYYFLKALYQMDSDHGHFALEMMTSCDTNSWCHMIQVGATAVMEAWSREEKANLSWSHPWASAPVTRTTLSETGTPLRQLIRHFNFVTSTESIVCYIYINTFRRKCPSVRLLDLPHFV